MAPSISAPARSTPQHPCPAAKVTTNLTDPPDLYAKNGVLDVKLTLTQQLISGSPVLCWTYASPIDGKQISVPPTLNVRQGERLSITLVNTLTIPNGNIQTPPPLKVDRGGSNDSMSMPMSMTANQPDPYALMCHQPQLAPTPTPDPVTGRIYHYQRAPWNEANLHFHGLNTSPNQPSDDVVNVLLCPVSGVAGPIGSYHYIVDIPRNEPPGLYWYHPHAHGESLYQVFQGLTGAIVVHTLYPSIPDKLPQHIAVVRDTPAHAGILKYPLERKLMQSMPNMSQIRAQVAAGIPNVVRGPGPDPFQAPDQCPGPKIPFNTTSVTINGLGLPINGDTTIGLPETKIGLGETQYWRLANTDGQTSLDMVLLVNGKQTPFMVTARDGVPLVVKNGRPTYQPVAMNHIFLTPAGRIEFYLTGTTPGADMVIRTQEINTGCVGDTDLARNMFYLKVGTKHVTQRVVIPTAVDPVAMRFSDLAAQKPVRKRTFAFTEYIRADQAEPDFYITEVSNPKAVEHPYRMTGPPDTVVKEGTVEEWTFYNFTNEIHGFHIHQVHFMPTDGVTVPEGLGQLVDTVFIPHGGYVHGKFVPRRVKILMDFRGKDIIGTFVYHCHFLEHEDNGMMARIQVVP